MYSKNLCKTATQLCNDEIIQLDAIDKTKILMTDGSLLKVESMQNAPLGAFCNAFDLHY